MKPKPVRQSRSAGRAAGRRAQRSLTGRGAAGRPLVARFDHRRFRWRGVTARPYRRPDAAPRWKGVERFVLLGAAGEPAAFQLRYFEIAPGGFSSHERHQHAHAVLVVRGRGRVRLDGRSRVVGPMDFIYIPPGTPHQFRAGREPFGFICPVDAVRDRPRPVVARRTRTGRRGAMA